MNTQKFKLELGKQNLVVEIKNLAEFANGNVLVSYGETTVLATCCLSKQENDKGFFPLTVGYEEKFYAAGKIRGSRYMRREGRPSDEATLIARLIDRAIRPRFPKNFKGNEIQVVITVLSWDGQNDPDILGLFAASLALSISDIPWSGPLGVARIGITENDFVLNPTIKDREKDPTEIVFAGLEADKEKEILINMIEAQVEEKEEKIISDAWEFTKKHIKILIDFQKEITSKIGKDKIVIAPSVSDIKLEKEIKDFLREKGEEDKSLLNASFSSKTRAGEEDKSSSSTLRFARVLENALFEITKTKREEKMDALKKELLCFVEDKYPEEKEEKSKYAMDFFKQEIETLIQQNAVQKEKRPDGRKINEIREIECEAGLLFRTHGSGLFQRGQTKSLSILTLGAPGDVQLLDGMKIVGKKRFMHHYNFPPYSTGEVKPMRGPGRRDIGHGILVEKALLPLIPNFEEFPYTIRIVTEILSSNGSTSMASVSSSSIALMDAGVPIKGHATGIAIGLMNDDKGNYKLLTDIQGPEDHHGNMDFKVAGTKKGITAIQMDVKIEGIDEKILKQALELGRQSRLEILEKMEKVLPKYRPQLSSFAPKILSIQINPEKIRDVVGPGGKIINEIIEKCDATIDIEPSGLIFVTGEKEENANKAIEWIKNITREARVGEIFQGKVVRIMDFGAFVEIFPNQDGLVHISQLASGRVNKVEDVVKINDVIPVKVISIDEQGKISLSLKDAKI